MMKSGFRIALAFALVVFLAACGGGSALKGGNAGGDQGATTGGAGAGTGTGGAETSGAGGAGAQGQPLVGSRGAMAGEKPEKMRVYFEFDSSAIDADNRVIVEQHAAYLMANTAVKVTLQGNTDERGTREYNLALGERRATSVERMLRVLGVSSERITTISYGEEQPVAMGHDESSWRLNRRVEFVYQN
jgi:peptidoglycan-associated lipoprotein